MLTSQCVKVGSNITLHCPVEEELSDIVIWIPNEIHDHDDFDGRDITDTLEVTFPSNTLNDKGLVACDYRNNFYYGIILISGMFNLRWRIKLSQNYIF